jgi:hypothetical protein
MKRERLLLYRENEIEIQNMMLLEKLYNILSVNIKPEIKQEQKSLNYPKRKKEIGRINQENKNLYKSLVQAKPSVDLKKIDKWNTSMEKYKKNISSSSRRKNPYMPILTQGLLTAYPEMRPKTSTLVNRMRKLSAEVPSIDHFSNLLHQSIENSLE